MNGSYALMGSSAVIRHVQHLVVKVAENNSTTLITGESGTGKELIARIIHGRSAQKSGPFLMTKCRAGHSDQTEEELFHATESIFLRAGNGTVLVEEIANLTSEQQLKVMRILCDGSLGGKPIHCRFLFSTSSDLEMNVRKGVFREDLLYKIATQSIYLPPLRERKEDIVLLCDYFISHFNHVKSKKINAVTHDCMLALMQYHWPNNLVELENLMERVVVLKNSGNVDICDLPPKIRNLITDNIDKYYEQSLQNKDTSPQNLHNLSGFSDGSKNAKLSPHYGKSPLGEKQILQRMQSPIHDIMQGFHSPNSTSPQNPLKTNQNYQESISDIEMFIKKDIDLGTGIDFYRVVEEFENKLISEALRRTNHNKNRAAQLLSMNRTTLVEKLKKRVTTSPLKPEIGKVKKHSAFTIFDGLGEENHDFEKMDFMSVSMEE